MRKKIASVSKRKWIVGGCLFFGGAALLTTGFATWIIGTQILTDRNQVSVTVDTAKNESVSISATLSDSSIYLRENVAQDTTNEDQIVFTDNDEAADLSIAFSTITIECGVEFYQRNYCQLDSENNYVPVPFTLSLGIDMLGEYMASLPVAERDLLDDVGPNNQFSKTSSNVKFTDDHLKNDKDGNPIDTFNYIELKTTSIALSAAEVGAWTDTAGGFKQLIITNKTVEFQWGNFFSYVDDTDTIVNNGPAAFYNHLSATKGLSWRTLSNLQKVEDEITMMNEAFAASEGKTAIIAVKISLPEVK